MFKLKVFYSNEDREEVHEFANDEERERFVDQLTREEPGVVYMLYGQGTEQPESKGKKAA